MNKFVKLSWRYFRTGVKCTIRGCKHYLIGRFYQVILNNYEKTAGHYDLAIGYANLAYFSLETARSLLEKWAD